MILLIQLHCICNDGPESGGNTLMFMPTNWWLRVASQNEKTALPYSVWFTQEAQRDSDLGVLRDIYLVFPVRTKALSIFVTWYGNIWITNPCKLQTKQGEYCLRRKRVDIFSGSDVLQVSPASSLWEQLLVPQPAWSQSSSLSSVPLKIGKLHE